MQELTLKAFQEPSTASKVMVPSFPSKLPVDLYSELFKTPTVEEEMTNQVGNISHLSINPDLSGALELYH